MNWTALIVATILNSLACGGIVLAQVRSSMMPGRLSMIPGTDQPFLYWQDFYCQKIGCLFGLPLVLAGYVHPSMTSWKIYLTIAIAAIGAVMFTRMCLGKNHKPDYGFPTTGKISLAGQWYSVYWGYMVAVNLICIWSIISGTLRGPMMWLAIAGAVIYLASFVCDLKAGHFAPVKYITNEDHGSEAVPI